MILRGRHPFSGKGPHGGKNKEYFENKQGRHDKNTSTATSQNINQEESIKSTRKVV